MPSKQTQNYHLSQWEPEDKVVHDDFNADNLAIDAAIKAVADQADALAASKADASALTKEISDRTSAVSSLQSTLNTLQTTVNKKQDASSAVLLKVGYYTGNTNNATGTQTISVGFKPKAVLVTSASGNTFNTMSFTFVNGGLALADSPGVYDGHTTLELTSSGFTVYNYWTTNGSYFIRLNYNGDKYHYIAFG